MIYVLLPAFNEERGLASLLDRLRAVTAAAVEPYRVVVVDDGSSDGTACVAEGFAGRLELRLLRHSVNQGLGAALRSGVRLVLSDAAAGDVLVTMDADDSHDPSLVPVLVGALRRTRTDVAIASRFVPGGQEIGVPLLRRWLSRAAALCYRAALPMPGVRDYSSGFRALRVETLQAARAAAGCEIPAEPGFTSAVELLLRARETGAAATEVPLVLRYDRKESPRKMRVGRTVLASLVLIARSVARPVMPAVAAERAAGIPRPEQARAA